MSKKIRKELEELIQIIASYPNGLSIEELSNLLTTTTPKRTLQYRLSNLVKIGLLKIEGVGRSSKYLVTKNLETTLKTELAHKVSIIPLSDDSEELQKL